MSVTVKADVFPAVLQITGSDDESRTVDKVRVIITEGTPDKVLVFQDASTGPSLIYSAEVTGYTPPKTAMRLREMHQPEFTTHAITTPTTTLTVTKSGGCGCGSRLKSFNPFPTITSLAAAS